MYRRSLARHVRRNHTAHPVFDFNQCEFGEAQANLYWWWKQRIDGAVPAAAAKKRRIAPEFRLQKTFKSLGGAVEQFTLNMKEANHL